MAKRTARSPSPLEICTYSHHWLNLCFQCVVYSPADFVHSHTLECPKLQLHLYGASSWLRVTLWLLIESAFAAYQAVTLSGFLLLLKNILRVSWIEGLSTFRWSIKNFCSRARAVRLAWNCVITRLDNERVDVKRNVNCKTLNKS